MITFIRGIVYAFGADYVILDNNGIGYYVNFSHPEILHLGEELTVFTYQHFREDGTVLYGFGERTELELFNKLITVRGLGPKTAMTILANSRMGALVEAIENGDIAYIKKLPGIGAKTAQQIILDLKGKLVENPDENARGNQELDEAVRGLKALGYRSYEINAILPDIRKQDLDSADEYLKAGLKLLMARKAG